MAARTYVYFDSSVSTTAYQTTTTAADSVGQNKILVAVAEDATDEAFFQVFGGIGGVLLTGNELAANSVVANNISAGAVTASKLSIGKGGSTLNLDPEFSDESSWYVDPSQVVTVATNGEWSIASGPVSGAPTGGGVITLNQDSDEDLWSERMPIDENKTYRVSVYAQQPSGTRNQYLCVDFHDDSGTQITGSGGGATGWTSTGTYHYWVISNANYASAWTTKYEFTFGANGTATIPSGAVSCSIGVLGNWSGSGTTRVDLNDYRLEEVIPGVLIEDGAITADQLAATITYTKELIVSTDGEIHSAGKDTPTDTTAGFFLGYSGSDYQFAIGTTNSFYIHWDGSDLVEKSLSTQIIKTKDADEVRNNTTTQSDDSDLSGFELQPDTWYSLEIYLNFFPHASMSTPEGRWSLQFSQTPQDYRNGIQIDSGSALSNQVRRRDLSSSIITFTGDLNTESVMRLTGSFHTNATTGGTVDFQWAQNIAVAFDLTLRSGSYMQLIPLVS